MRGPKTVTIQDFSTGLVETEGGVDLTLGAAQALQNVMPIGHRGLKRREPAQLVNSFAQNVRSLFFSPAMNSYLALGATNAYTGFLGAFPSPAHGFSDPTHAGWAEAPVSGGQGPVFLQQGGVAKFMATGSPFPALGDWTASAGTLPLVAADGCIAYHGNRMWVGGTSANPSRLYFSEIGDPRIWSGGTSGYVDVDPSAGGGIKAICPCGPYLLVFKTSRVYVVYDLNTGAHRALSRTLGVTNQTCVTEGRYGTVYFAAVSATNNAAIYRTDGNTLESVAPQLGIALSSASLAFGGEFLFALELATTPTQFWVYSERLQSWWRHSWAGTAASTGFAAAPTFGPQSSEFALAASGGKLLSWYAEIASETSTTGGDGDGTAITSYWWGGDLDMGAAQLRKRLRHIDIEGAGLASAGAAADCASSAPSVRSLSFGPSGSTVKSARLHNFGVAHYWAPYLYDSASSAWSVRAVSLDYSVRAN